MCRAVSKSGDDPLCVLNIISADGKISTDHIVPIHRGQLMHDFGITKSYAVFVDNAVVFKPEAMIADPCKGFPFLMDKGSPCHIILVLRDDPSQLLEFDIASPFAFFHTVNSWEDGVPGQPGHKVHVVLCRYASPLSLAW
jgi:carotenoid 9,10(9',10')-cleavage dioxygenase 1